MKTRYFPLGVSPCVIAPEAEKSANGGSYFIEDTTLVEALEAGDQLFGEGFAGLRP